MNFGEEKVPQTFLRRKILQIHTQMDGSANSSIFALCDDGTVWRHSYLGHPAGSWIRIVDIPQDQPKEVPVASQNPVQVSV